MGARELTDSGLVNRIGTLILMSKPVAFIILLANTRIDEGAPPFLLVTARV